MSFGRSIWAVCRTNKHNQAYIILSFVIIYSCLFLTHTMYFSGTISIDGVHPSNQGYNWWALNIAEAILASELEYVD